MTTSSPLQRHIGSRHRHESGWSTHLHKTGTETRREMGHRGDRGGDAQVTPIREKLQIRPVERPQEGLIEPLSVGDACDFLTLLAMVVVVLLGIAHGGHYILSEITRYSTMDVIRMLGGMP